MQRRGRGYVQLADDALSTLCRYPWPGNIRELANLLERLAVMFPEQLVSTADLPARYRVVSEHLAATAPVDAVASGVDTRAEQSSPDDDHDAERAALADVTISRDHGPDRLSEMAEEQAERSLLLAGNDPLPEQGLDLKEHMAQIEIGLIQAALDRTGGVVAHAAQMLGLRRTTLAEKLRKYGLDNAGQQRPEP